MAIKWYFGQNNSKDGPFTAKQMQDLAASGELRPTDTVWKEGVEQGVVATRVEHLFAASSVPQAGSPPGVAGPAVPALAPAAAAAPPSPPQPAAQELPPPDSLPEDAGLVPLEEAPVAANAGSEGAPAKRPPPPRQEVRKRRVISIRGGVIVSQDGAVVRFRKSCVKCNHPDTSVTSMAIPSGCSRVPFFCPKCRKSHPVEIQGVG